MSKKHNKPDTQVEQVEVQTLEDALGLAGEAQETQDEQAELPLDETAPVDEVVEETNEQEAQELDTVEDPDAERGKLVLDSNGIPMYRKLKPTYAAPEVKGKKRERVATMDRKRVKQYEVGGNAALITFPTDRYGITKDIKTAMIRAASRIAGDVNKKELVEEVVAILSKHIEIKFNADRAYREKLAKADK